MTDPKSEDRGQGSPEPLVHCRRTGQEYDGATHERCPYCFGQSAHVRPGAHDDFCDFDPKKDSVSFGFPEGAARDAHG